MPFVKQDRSWRDRDVGKLGAGILIIALVRETSRLVFVYRKLDSSKLSFFDINFLNSLGNRVGRRNDLHSVDSLSKAGVVAIKC